MFVAPIVGFVMGIYTFETFGVVEAVVAPLLLMPLARIWRGGIRRGTW